MLKQKMIPGSNSVTLK